MNNYEAIEKQWKVGDDFVYPNLFLWINSLMEVKDDSRKK